MSSMGLLKGGAIFGLGAAVGIFLARNRDRQDFRKRAFDNCPLNKAKQLEKAKETTQIPANNITPADQQPNYQ